MEPQQASSVEKRKTTTTTTTTTSEATTTVTTVMEVQVMVPVAPPPPADDVEPQVLKVGPPPQKRPRKSAKDKNGAAEVAAEDKADDKKDPDAGNGGGADASASGCASASVWAETNFKLKFWHCCIWLQCFSQSVCWLLLWLATQDSKGLVFVCSGLTKLQQDKCVHYSPSVLSTCGDAPRRLVRYAMWVACKKWNGICLLHSTCFCLPVNAWWHPCHSYIIASWFSGCKYFSR